MGWEVAYERFVNGRGAIETRLGRGGFRTDFDNGDIFRVDYRSNYEFLNAPFQIARGVLLPIQGYSFNELQSSYELAPVRKVSGVLRLTRGGFYSGDRTEAGYAGRVELSSQLAVEPRVSVNWVNLTEGDFTAKLAGARVIYTLTPRMFVGTLIQYDSSLKSVETNARLRWEYQPGSDLFIVYTDGRDASERRLQLVNRGVAVKLTRLLRF